jgi:hypothetical protein
MSDGGWAALAAPTGVAASDGTIVDAVRVTWSAVTGAQAYRVWSSWSSNPQTATVQSSWQANASYDDGSFSPGAVRYYWVQASPYPTGGRNSSLGGPDSGWFLPATIFSDGFESSDHSHWSATVP